MRILHLSTRLILGGSQENTVLSCEGQANLGHEVHLAYGPIYGPEGSLLERVEAFRTNDGQNRPITTHTIPNMVRELAPMKDYRAYHECRRLIREIQPDIVHTHSSKAGIVGRAAAWAEGGRAGKIGVVHTIHGLPFHPYEKKWRNAIYILSERWAARRCHKIVTVCDAMTRQARAAGVGKSEQFQTVYSGMEIEHFLNPLANGETRDEVRRELGIQPNDFVIGTVARLAELKGHDDLLDALGETMKQNVNWKLLWVGDGWWRDRLMVRVDEMGLTDQVITTGLVPPEIVPRMMASMDVLVHPSYREGLPRTVPQALLGGVPVVVNDVDGGPEVCQDQETGRLVNTGNTDQLRDAVEWMADHGEERCAMARRGRAWCEARFSAARMVEALDDLYRELHACRF